MTLPAELGVERDGLFQPFILHYVESCWWHISNIKIHNIHIHIHIHIRIHIHMHIHLDVHLDIDVHIHIHIDVHLHIHLKQVFLPGS